MTMVRGLCESGFDSVGRVLAELVGSGREPGGSFAVFREGRPVIDLVFGEHRDGVPYAEHSLALSFSTGKPLVALTVLDLVSDRLLGLDDPIARYWPEFAAAGKDQITIRDVLCHRSGLWAFPADSPADPLDEDGLFASLAAMQPLHPPRAAVAEHALTYGHLLDPVVRAVTGRRLADHWASIALAHGWDLALAVPQDRLGRVAPPVVLDPAWSALAPAGSPGERATSWPPGLTDPAVVSSNAFRQQGFPAISLHATALSLADFFSDITDPGGRVGLLLGPELHALYLLVQAEGDDLVLGRPAYWTLGLQHRQDGGMDWIGHGGLGGSSAGWVGGVAEWSYGYVSRGLGRHDRQDEVLAAVSAALA